MVRTSSPNPKSPAKSKASKQQQTLPSVAAVQDALPWTPGHGGRAVGRTAVADTDLPAGCLVMQERALLLIPRSGTASHVCHACLEPMMPAKAQKGPGGAEDGTSNPLLPRYCSRACAAPRLLRDGHLLPLRRGLADISREHGVDPELLHLVALLDLDGGTGAPAAPAPGPAPAEPGAGAPPPPPLVVACGPADVACLHSSWDKRPAPWRGALGPALRAVHAQLAALAAGGKLAGYAAPGTLPELQARAAMLATNLVGTGPSTEAGLALFPGLASFSHSCMPNCIWIAAGDTVYVRTVVPIKAGEPLTLSFAPLYEPRSVRKQVQCSQRHAATLLLVGWGGLDRCGEAPTQWSGGAAPSVPVAPSACTRAPPRRHAPPNLRTMQTLAMERGVSCACTRCVSPLATSSDRFLEVRCVLAAGADCTAYQNEGTVLVNRGQEVVALVRSRASRQCATCDRPPPRKPVCRPESFLAGSIARAHDPLRRVCGAWPAAAMCWSRRPTRKARRRSTRPRRASASGERRGRTQPAWGGGAASTRAGRRRAAAPPPPAPRQGPAPRERATWRRKGCLRARRPPWRATSLCPAPLGPARPTPRLQPRRRRQTTASAAAGTATTPTTTTPHRP
uniref:SET domain-containing protein n=1 Tax=Auxenochlorella protothecoides TaxID=3075 RepID=A0A1D2AE23_AUXPR